MFEFAASPLPVPPQLRDTFANAWRQIAQPGGWWTGSERVEIAQVARSTRNGDATPRHELPDPAAEAIELLAARPAYTTKEWVGRICNGLGEARYVELTGIVARVVAVDTVTRLLGCDLEPFPDPQSGEPSGESPARDPRRGRAWISIDGIQQPTNVLSLVPSAKRETVAVSNVLYMSPQQMEDPDIELWGLHRTQIELVATTTSYGNECFY